jgi:hypothetical protein
LNRNLNPLAHSGSLSGSYGCQSLVLRLLARLAALRLVLQSLVMEKGLFARRPNERLITVNTLNAAIWMLGILRGIQFLDFFPL